MNTATGGDGVCWCANCGLALGAVVPSASGTPGAICCIRCQWRPLWVSPAMVEHARGIGVLAVYARPPDDPCPVELDPLTRLRLN